MLRRATEEDRDRVLVWRNHPEVRQASFTRHVITSDEHSRWWDLVCTDSSRIVLIYEHAARQPCGVVIFSGLAPDAAPSTLTWSYYLDVEGLDERGETLPAWLGIERESLEYAFRTLEAGRVVGHVLEQNTPVRRLHRRHGIRERGTDTRSVDGQPVPFVEIEITADEWVARRNRAATP